MANEITAELTDDQLKKFEIMKEHDMGIGDAIDLIFDLREELKLNNEELLEDRLSELNDKKKLQEIINRTKSFTRDEFSRLLFRCHNIIRNNDKLSPEAAFDEISKILFMKMNMTPMIFKDICILIKVLFT